MKKYLLFFLDGLLNLCFNRDNVTEYIFEDHDEIVIETFPSVRIGVLYKTSEGSVIHISTCHTIKYIFDKNKKITDRIVMKKALLEKGQLLEDPELHREYCRIHHEYLITSSAGASKPVVIWN